jgi:hypothetical protein
MLFALPAATTHELRWLNAIAGDYNYDADYSGDQQPNRISFAAVIGFSRDGTESVDYLLPSMLSSSQCTFEFTAPTAQQWPSASPLTDEQGTPFAGGITLHASDTSAKHFHLIEKGKKGDDPFEQHSSFLEERVTMKSIPFLDIIMQSVIDGQLGMEVQGVSDYLTVALNEELFAKLCGFISGTTTSGALPKTQAPIFIEVDSQMLVDDDDSQLKSKTPTKDGAHGTLASPGVHVIKPSVVAPHKSFELRGEMYDSNLKPSPITVKDREQDKERFREREQAQAKRAAAHAKVVAQDLAEEFPVRMNEDARAALRPRLASGKYAARIAARKAAAAIDDLLDHRRKTHQASVAYKAMRFAEVSQHTYFRSAMQFNPPPDIIDGVVTHNMINVLSRDLTTSLSQSITDTLTDTMGEHLHDMLSSKLRDRLEYDMSEAVSSVSTETLKQTLTETIPTMIERTLPHLVMNRLARVLTQTLTRSLSHSLAPTLMFTMKHSMQEEPFCYYCKIGQTKFCNVCHRNSKEDYANYYYTDWFSSFFSDYYSDYFSGGSGKTPAGKDGAGVNAGEFPEGSHQEFKGPDNVVTVGDDTVKPGAIAPVSTSTSGNLNPFSTQNNPEWNHAMPGTQSSPPPPSTTPPVQPPPLADHPDVGHDPYGSDRHGGHCSLSVYQGHGSLVSNVGAIIVSPSFIAPLQQLETVAASQGVQLHVTQAFMSDPAFAHRNAAPMHKDLFMAGHAVRAAVSDKVTGQSCDGLCLTHMATAPHRVRAFFESLGQTPGIHWGGAADPLRFDDNLAESNPHSYETAYKSAQEAHMSKCLPADKN